jgi:arylsulfatase A-like enzyme
MREAYREMIVELDRGVGEIVATLRRLGLAERTLVWFISDNGGTGPGSNGTLRGRKGTVWEGGHRVPAIAWWPERIAAGSTNDSLALTMDVLPTLLDLAGVEPPKDRRLDGINLSGVLLRGETVRDRKEFWQHGRATAMRDGAWKLVLGGGNAKPSLFDLSRDLGETRDLAAEHPDRVEAMTNAIDAWSAEVTPR